MVYLKYSIDTGEGDVNVTEAFKELNSLLRMDLLGDWLSVLQREYDKAREDFSNDYR